MEKHILRIRKNDRIVFDSIKNGEKTIETRAATDKFRNIKAGDVLVFVCQDEKLEKSVKKTKRFKSIEEMLEKIDFRKIMPFIDSVQEVKKVYYSFSGYREKIKQFGLVAFWLE